MKDRGNVPHAEANAASQQSEVLRETRLANTMPIIYCKGMWTVCEGLKRHKHHRLEKLSSL